MGNEDKIETVQSDLEKDVMLFLGDELGSLRKAKRINVYDLVTEYSKTRKNKLWSVWIALALTFAVVVLVTIFTMRGLSASNENVEVNLSSFETLNLQNLFDQVSRIQEKYDEATKRRVELKGNLDARLARAEMKRESDLELLKNTRLSRSVAQARRAQILSDYEKEIADAHNELDENLAVADAEVAQYAEQLKSYDGENLIRDEKLRQQIDSERQLHQLEKQRLVRTYEDMLENSRVELQETRIKEFEERRAATTEITNRYEAEIALYDPIINDAKILSIVSDAGKLDVAEKYSLERIVDSDANLSESFIEALKQIEENYGNLDTLYKQSASIPNRNTMRSVVNAERKLSVELANGLTLAAVSEIEDISQKLRETEAQRDSERMENLCFESILNSDIADEKTAGFVMAVSGKYGLPVFIREAALPQITRDGSTRVDVFSGRTKISSGYMLFADGKYFVALDNEADNEKISVGNTFRISTKK
ncbi:MAG: hypothetical protein K2N58_06965 [Treponemataceae bacterium]|nr:hypothetical protein [Treponemataceae bacterium]